MDFKFNFELNEMQVKASQMKGANIVFNAPTNSGKTEAILLAIKRGQRVAWFLPTISACIFMYRRLCRDFDNLSIRVRTSLMSESREVEGALYSIDLMAPDMPMISAIRAYYSGDDSYNPEYDTYVIDEVDSYPTRLRKGIEIFIRRQPELQFLIASATIDSSLQDLFKDMEEINYHRPNRILYKNNVSASEDILTPLRFYKKKKIVYIMNTIAAIDEVVATIEEDTNLKFSNAEDSRLIILHSGLDLETRMRNEEKLFNGDYDILVSNDIISTSIDIDIEVLAMEVSDKMNINIQRLGRLNRRGTRIGDENLFFLLNIRRAPFIDEDEAWRIHHNIFKNEDRGNYITQSDIESYKDLLTLDSMSDEEFWGYVRYRIDQDLPIKLRDLGITYKYPATVQIANKKKGTIREKESYKLLKLIDQDTPSYIEEYQTTLGQGGEANIIELGYQEYVIEDLRDLEVGIITLRVLKEDEPKYRSRQEIKRWKERNKAISDSKENYHLKKVEGDEDYKYPSILEYLYEVYGTKNPSLQVLICASNPSYPDDRPAIKEDLEAQLGWRAKARGVRRLNTLLSLLELLDPDIRERSALSFYRGEVGWSSYRYKKEEVDGRDYVLLGFYYSTPYYRSGRIEMTIDIEDYETLEGLCNNLLDSVYERNLDNLNLSNREEYKRLAYLLWGEGQLMDQEEFYRPLRYTIKIEYEEKGVIRNYKNRSAHPLAEIPDMLKFYFRKFQSDINSDYFLSTEDNLKNAILLLNLINHSIYYKKDEIPRLESCSYDKEVSRVLVEIGGLYRDKIEIKDISKIAKAYKEIETKELAAIITGLGYKKSYIEMLISISTIDKEYSSYKNNLYLRFSDEDHYYQNLGVEKFEELDSYCTEHLFSSEQEVIKRYFPLIREIFKVLKEEDIEDY